MSESNSESAVRICSIDDVAEDSPYVGDVDGVSVAVFLTDGDYFAVNNTCPHQGGPLAQGKVEDACVYCPWHGWQFDLESGEHVQGEKKTATYEVSVDGDDVFLTV